MVTMEDTSLFCDRRAKGLLEKGLRALAQGKFSQALADFRASSYVHPTAEGLTFWGWMEARLGNFDQAIELCLKAIELDADFGNPYNDIGTYLTAKSDPDLVPEAIEWFNKALRAKRYASREYPHINLGRIFLSQKLYSKALKEFKMALKYSPRNFDVLWAINHTKKYLQ
jgi:tetratricopeptide (TPR) repeat protein